MYEIQKALRFLPAFSRTELKCVCLHFDGFFHVVSRAQFPPSVFLEFFVWEGHI